MTERSKKLTKYRYLYLGTGIAATLTEMSLLGHPMESMKIIRQATNKSYFQITNSIRTNYGIKGFYRGFYPWGIIQSVKGLPVIYTQTLVKDIVYNNKYSEKTAGIIGGICGGVSQAFFITPLQRLKTEAMTGEKDSTKLLSKIFKKQGVLGLFRGLTPMIFKRGLDWGIRFYGVETFRHNFPDYYQSLSGKFMAGAFGGLLSLFTMPFDVMVAMLQKSQSNGSIRKSFLELKMGGMSQFYRGMVIRAIHSSYHTGMVVSLSLFYKNLLEKYIIE